MVKSFDETLEEMLSDKKSIKENRENVISYSELFEGFVKSEEDIARRRAYETERDIAQFSNEVEWAEKHREEVDRVIRWNRRAVELIKASLRSE